MLSCARRGVKEIVAGIYPAKTTVLKMSVVATRPLPERRRRRRRLSSRDVKEVCGTIRARLSRYMTRSRRLEETANQYLQKHCVRISKQSCRRGKLIMSSVSCDEDINLPNKGPPSPLAPTVAFRYGFKRVCPSCKLTRQASNHESSANWHIRLF